MNPEQQMEQRGSQWSITVFEEEYFQGKCCHFTMECQNILDRDFRKIRSIKVENGPSFEIAPSQTPGDDMRKKPREEPDSIRNPSSSG